MSDLVLEPILKKHCPGSVEQEHACAFTLLEPHRDLIYYLMRFLDHKEKLQFSMVNKRVLAVFRQQHIHRLRIKLPIAALQKTASKELLACPAVSVGKKMHLAYWIKLKKAHLGQQCIVTDIKMSKTFPLPPLWSGLTHLKLSAQYNTELGTLPASLVSLKLGSRFDRYLGILPNGLEHLKCGFFFNELPTHWPASLRSLRVDQSGAVLQVLPPALTTLRIVSGRPLPPLPQTLTDIIGLRHTNGVTEYPPALRYIKLGSWENGSTFHVPSSLTSLDTGPGFRGTLVFPPDSALTTLKFGYNSNHPLMQLPPKLVSLDLGKSNQSHPIGALPDTLQVLLLNHSYGHPLGTLPLGLRHLELNQGFDHPIGPLPPRLEILHLGKRHTKPIGALPSTLQTLCVGDAYNVPLGDLPAGLKTLRLGSKFNQALGPFPPGLEELALRGNYRKPLHPFPASLRKLDTEGNVHLVFRG
jgi:hypothetical protein